MQFATHTHTHVHAHAHLYIEKHTHTAISTCALCMFSAAMLATLFAFCKGVGSARFCISFRLAFCNVCSHMCHIAILSCFCGFGLVFATHTCISICRLLNFHPPAGPVMPVMRLPCWKPAEPFHRITQLAESLTTFSWLNLITAYWKWLNFTAFSIG